VKDQGGWVHFEEKRSAYRVLVGKAEGKRPVEYVGM
jgi:hypothetical protein